MRKNRRDKLSGVVLYSLLLASLLISTRSVSDEESEQKLQRFGFDFYSGILHTEGPDYSEENSPFEGGVSLKRATVETIFKLNDVTDLDLAVDLLAAEDTDVCENAYISRRVNQDIKLDLGQQQINLGGFERRRRGARDFGVNPYLDELHPFESSQPALRLDLFGTVSFQLTDDVTTKSSSVGVFTGDNKQPAVVTEAEYTLGRVTTLLQGGLYDLNKSKHISLGFLYDSESVYTYFDYIRDDRRQKYIDSAEIHVPLLTYTTQTLYLQILRNTILSPYIKAIVFDAKQPSVASLGLEDHKVNSDGFDDNARMLMVGVRNSVSFKPIELSFSYYEVSAKFARLDGSEETKTWQNYLMAFGIRKKEP